jgi:hypothetical protein
MIIKLLIFTSALAAVSAQIRWYNTDDCSNHAAITDSTGKVVKNVCQLNWVWDYTSALTACAAKGMDLFWAEEAAIFKSFQNYVKTLSVPCGTATTWNTTCGFWINGKNEGNSLMILADGTQNVVNPIPDYYAPGVVSGQNIPGSCKVAKLINGVAMTSNWDCSKFFNPICEYNNTYTRRITPPQSITCATRNEGKRYVNLNNCKAIKTVRNDCGNVVKGICELNVAPMNYDQAIQACDRVGMDLFVAENQAVLEEFERFVNRNHYNSPWGSTWGTSAGFWVGGRRHGTNVNEYIRVKDMTLQKMAVWKSPTVSYSITYDLSLTPMELKGPCLVLKRSFNSLCFTEQICNQTYGEFKSFEDFNLMANFYIFISVPMCEFDSKF